MRCMHKNILPCSSKLQGLSHSAFATLFQQDFKSRSAQTSNDTIHATWMQAHACTEASSGDNRVFLCPICNKSSNTFCSRETVLHCATLDILPPSFGMLLIAYTVAYVHGEDINLTVGVCINLLTVRIHGSMVTGYSLLVQITCSRKSTHLM